MNPRGHIVDRLNESLIPLANSTREVRGSSIGTNLSTCLAVNEQAWGTAPVQSATRSTHDEILKNLAIDLKSNLLRENRRKLNLSVEVVIGVEVLT